MDYLSFFFRAVLSLYFCLQFSLWANGSDNYLEKLRKNILESQYTFSSEISKFSSNHGIVYEVPHEVAEVALGKKIFLTNRVLRERFRVAGKPVTVFFSRPQIIEPVTGLRSAYLEVSNSYVYQDLTDERGEMVFAFTPTRGQLDVDIHFTTVPKNYTEHINQIKLWVYDPQEIEFSFYILPYLWLALFLFILLLLLGEQLTSRITYLSKFSKLFFSFSPLLKRMADLFPYLVLVVPVTGREALIRQGGMVVAGISIALLIQIAPIFLLTVVIFGFFGLKEKMMPFIALSGLLLIPYLFLREFSSLESLLQYINKDDINFLIVLTVIAASPSLLAGMTTLAWLQYSGFITNVFYFFHNPTFLGDQISSSLLLSFSQFFEFFFFRNYFFLFLLSLALTGLVFGYRFCFFTVTKSK